MKNESLIKQRVIIEFETIKRDIVFILKSDIAKEYSYSLSSSSVSSHFETKIYELQQRMGKDSMFGDCWASHGCTYDLPDAEWIVTALQICLEHHPNEDVIWSGYRRFLRDYFRLLEYKKYCIKSDIINEKGQLANIDQQALIAFYESKFITEKEGLKLSRRYRYYKKNMDRRTSPPKEINSDLKAINYFEKRKEVISYLSIENQKKAQDELDMLKRNLKAEYPNCIFK
jgi:hypothetical protein